MTDGAASRTLPHLAHWGAFRVTVEDDCVIAVAGHPDDPAPSPLHENVVEGAERGRVARPAIREGWLRNGPGPDDQRGTDRYVEVPWDEALDLAATELDRVRTEHGNEAIFGGSYGWSSAGRFHHAQSQLHRFLNCIGGYTASVNSYSLAASEVLVPHVLGTLDDIRYRATTWPDILEHTELVVAFGGMNVKNAWVTPGGVTRHTLAPALAEAGRRGLAFELVGPLRDDLPADVRARWHQVRPGTDTAVMLALIHQLVVTDQYDRGFLERCTVGWERIVDDVLGRRDGVVKDAAWAESISGVPAATIVELADRLVSQRSLITVSWALQRAEHGEQPVWAAIALAAFVGQIGLPGAGFGHGYGSMADVGLPTVPGALPTLPQGRNPVRTFIPVARITDLLTRPGEELDYNGRRLRLPDTRLVYWAGGNPFHHHQDLFGLRRAFARPDTVIVNEPYWTATARHADIVFPITTTLERDDIGAGRNDGYVSAMPRVLPPFGDARDDYAVFRGLAARLGVEETFSEGHDTMGWLAHLYGRFRARHGEAGVDLPEFWEFWERGEVTLPATPRHHTVFESFRHDPDAQPLPTPSGRIELFSSTVDSFGYDDCPGQPTWLPPREWAGSEVADRHPLTLVANQPARRLHSQLDGGRYSQAGKIGGREVVRLHPADAVARGIGEADVVRLFNDRGACLAAAELTDSVAPGVAQLSTGAWFTPVDDPTGPLCVQGNPNVLTADHGTSRLAQGSIGQLTMVGVERYDGVPDDRDPYLPPIVGV